MKIKPLAIIITAAILTGLIIALGFKKRRINPKGKSVIFIGDSLTAYFGNGWQDSLSSKYGMNLKWNLSQGGKTSKWGLEKMKGVFISNPKKMADIIFIYLGANDYYSPYKISNTYKNIQEIVDLSRKNGIEYVYVVSGYSSDKVTKNNPKVTSNQKQFIDKADQAKYGMKSAIKNAFVIPVYEDADVNSTFDGFHLTNTEQTKFADWMGKIIFQDV